MSTFFLSGNKVMEVSLAQVTIENLYCQLFILSALKTPFNGPSWNSTQDQYAAHGYSIFLNLPCVPLLYLGSLTYLQNFNILTSFHDSLKTINIISNTIPKRFFNWIYLCDTWTLSEQWKTNIVSSSNLNSQLQILDHFWDLILYTRDLFFYKV